MLLKQHNPLPSANLWSPHCTRACTEETWRKKAQKQPAGEDYSEKDGITSLNQNACLSSYLVSFCIVSANMKRPIKITIVGIRGREYPRIPAPPTAKATKPMKRLNLLILIPTPALATLRPSKISPTPKAM